MSNESLMFDFGTYYNRVAQQMPDDCKVAEIGVANAESALFLARQLHFLGKKFKMYMVDNMDYGGYFQLKTIYENIIKSGLGEFIEVVPYSSIQASRLFNDNYLHFCFIDASHEYEQTKRDIISWYPKVIDGGILAGHDYYREVGVHDAVNEIIPLYITRNDIEDREFEPEQFLHEEQTDNGYGIFYCVKDFYKHLNK